MATGQKIDHVFTYNRFLKFAYRYGNIPVSMLLGMYIVPFIADPSPRLVHYLFFFIVAVLLLGINAFFYKVWRVVPFKIHALDDRIVASEFFLTSKEVVLFYKDIENLKGGTFSGKFNGIMIAESTSQDIQIGFFARLENSRLFEAILISRAPQPVYEKVTALLKQRKEELKKKK